MESLLVLTGFIFAGKISGNKKVDNRVWLLYINYNILNLLDKN